MNTNININIIFLLPFFLPSSLIAHMVIGVRLFSFLKCCYFFKTSMRIAHMVLGVEFFLIHFSVLRAITHMVIAGGPFFSFLFLFLKSFSPQSQSLNGDWWRGLFSPPKPIAQMAVGGEGPFLFNSFRLCPLFFSILFGYAHILNLFSGDALFSVFFFLLCFLFSPL